MSEKGGRQVFAQTEIRNIDDLQCTQKSELES